MHKGEPTWWQDALAHFENDPIMGECIRTYGSEGLQGRGDLFYTIVRCGITRPKSSRIIGPTNQCRCSRDGDDSFGIALKRWLVL